MGLGTRISIAKVVLLSFLTATMLALAVVVVVSGHVRERSIQDLARDEARQTSALAFEALYSAMRKGWSKEEINEVVGRLKSALPDLSVNVVRGRPVVAQFGEIDNDLALAERDPVLRRALETGQEQLVSGEMSIRYLYPLVVRDECVVCHTMAKPGDVNGVIDIVYPIQALKVSLDYVLNTVLAYFLAILVLLSLALYLKLKILVARPITKMTQVMQEIIHHTDLSRRIQSTGYISEVADLTEYFNRLLRTVEEYQARLEEMSTRDPLTRLFNRRKFHEFLAHEIERSKRTGHGFCLAQIDLDDFKNINDTFGHPMGDLVLKEIAGVLQHEVRRTDILARVGGDEFAVLLPETSLEEGRRVVEKLRMVVAGTQLGLPVGDVRFTASLGLVEYPDCGEDGQKMSIAVDVAMYKAKRNGKNQVATLESADDATQMVFSRGEMVRLALADRRLVPFFQPIFNTRTGELSAYEVLARVIDGDRAVCAGDFIEEAEELGLADQIDAQMFEQAIDALASGLLGNARLFINLSARTLADHDRMRGLPRELKARGIDPSRIVLEITEREALPQFGDVVSLINELRTHGLAFALDDFGAGFSSFLYLKYISVDYVKIEGSFIRHMVTDERDRIMVEHIHSMARQFGMTTVAEFVEDAATQDLLHSMGIDLAQGYHLGRPRSLADIRADH